MENSCYNRGVGTQNPGIHLIVKGHDVTPLQEEILSRPCRYCVAECKVGLGFCHCGCGRKTNVFMRTNRYFGYRKGEPKGFVVNHHRIKSRQQDEMVTIEGKECVRLALTQEQFAIIDIEDYPRVKKFLWFAVRTPRNTFYARSGKDNENCLLHRFILDQASIDVEMVVDHKNGNGLDNRKSNLRVCTQSENSRNRSGASKVTQFKGIYLSKNTGKWIATLNLGSFDTEEEAARAYDHALRYVFVEFGKPNFKDDEKCA